jgi:hypothetical protein
MNSASAFQARSSAASSASFDAAMRLQAPWINTLAEGLSVKDLETTHHVMLALRQKLESAQPT